jgi:hypothetical protein
VSSCVLIRVESVSLNYNSIRAPWHVLYSHGDSASSVRYNGGFLPEIMPVDPMRLSSGNLTNITMRVLIVWSPYSPVGVEILRRGVMHAAVTAGVNAYEVHQGSLAYGGDPYAD